MHLKNFSLVREHDGKWHLSKAYDLVPVKVVLSVDEDGLALTVNGKKRNLSLADFGNACPSLRLTEVQFRRTMRRIATEVEAHCDEAFGRSILSGDFKIRCGKLIRLWLEDCMV